MFHCGLNELTSDGAGITGYARSVGAMTTVETIRFRLRDSIDDAAFRALDRRVANDYMARRPGFLSRETLRSPDGEYLVIVHWASEAEAEATINAFFAAPETQEFIAAVDTTTVASGRYLAS